MLERKPDSQAFSTEARCNVATLVLVYSSILLYLYIWYLLSIKLLLSSLLKARRVRLILLARSQVCWRCSTSRVDTDRIASRF
jgi:hypothetical protein